MIQSLTIVLSLALVISHRPLWNIRSLLLAHSSVDKGTEKRSSELQMLGLLNNLLVCVRGVIRHDHVASLSVDFRVQAGVSYQVDDPSLGFLFVHVELLSQSRDTDNKIYFLTLKLSKCT